MSTPYPPSGDQPPVGSYGNPPSGSAVPDYSSGGQQQSGGYAPYGGSPDQYGEGAGSGQARNGFGWAALILGILAVLTCWTVVGGILFGLAAIVFGFLARGRVKRREATNGGAAIAGIVLGVIGLLLSVALIALGASILNSEEGQKLQDCLNDATSASAQQQCRDDFQPNVDNG
jgi:hypothetical protein